MKTPVAIISLRNSLAAVGVRHLLEKNLEVSSLVVETDKLQEQTLRVEARYIIVDTDTFINHLDFLLPRRKSVILIREKIAENDALTAIDPSISESELVDAFNRIVFSESITNEPQRSALSQRETDVLKGIVAGKINKEIAADLGISINTVLTHRKNITSKLGIKSVSGLSIYALMNNLV